MEVIRKIVVSCFLLLMMAGKVSAQSKTGLDQRFLDPPASAKPWVFWYWMHAAVSKEGITADLEAMRRVGIGGAYLMPIKDTTSPPMFQPPARQLTGEWWQLVSFAMKEAKRLDLQLAMHVSDGFALAGGPWITPALSMQKLVWSKTYITKDTSTSWQLPDPPRKENYYRDIAVFAYPSPLEDEREVVLVPAVTTSTGARPSFLCFEDAGTESFRSDTNCWIQYKYPQAFTCRSIRIHTGGNNYQAHRLIVQASDDGVVFRTITRLQPPRHGWQDTDADVTHAIPATTARFFRFVYNKDGSEPGAEDLDAAKWKPSLKVSGIYLTGEPVIHQYESKNGSVWRVSSNTSDQVGSLQAVPLNKIINLSRYMDSSGRLRWTPPPGNWIVVRIGHSSTGHSNATGGAGKGLECDKFNAAAIKLQFDNWFAKAFEKTDKNLASQVLKIFHVDSWECGSQNWSPVFAAEFKKRRRYDPLPYLLAMTGVPIESVATSEKFLHDVRQTIAELVNDVFYGTLKRLSHEKGCSFSAESVAPTMVSDGLLHYQHTDLPMGEFWLNSPTHDKPNDMSDAISGAHIYGKNIVQAEAFTSLRMNWSEHPGNLKTIGDRNFALGINKMVLHVFTHNPWTNRKPGMTLDGVGLYFQRDQTWFNQSKAWIDYLARCQALLQEGKPVVDIAVFTGEELPRRSILPDRLVNTLPGIIGKYRIARESKRLANEEQPLRSIPSGVNHSANMADPEDWIDPLNGYTYDSFNPDALMRATVKNGRVQLPGGASYAMLVIPVKHAMNPNDNQMSVAVAKKLLQLVKGGATILLDRNYKYAVGLREKEDSVRIIMNEIFRSGKKGRAIAVPYNESTFVNLGLQKDVEIADQQHSIAWTHRRTADADIYFISNQRAVAQAIDVIFRLSKKHAEIWDPVTGRMNEIDTRAVNDGRTASTIELDPHESVFVIFRNPKQFPVHKVGKALTRHSTTLSAPWKVTFDKSLGGPPNPVIFNELTNWARHQDSAIRFYSGTALYTQEFTVDKGMVPGTAWLQFDSIYNIATVKVNGIDCGTLWTYPYRVEITRAIKEGLNELTVELTNTWANRLIGDQRLPVEKRITCTTAPYRLTGKPLVPGGMTGNVALTIWK